MRRIAFISGVILIAMLFFTACGKKPAPDEPPSNLSYPDSPFKWQIKNPVSAAPKVTGKVQFYFVSPKLPDGIFLNPENGIFYGTPIAPQDSMEYTITATNPSGSAVTTIIIKIFEAPHDLSYAGNPFVLWKGVAMSPAAAEVTGTADTFTVSPQLPSGITIDSVSGTISGKPDSTQEASVYTVTAVNSAGSTASTIEITVNDKPESLEYEKNPLIMWAGKSSSVKPILKGVANEWSITPDLPEGVNINPETGIISGTPLLSQIATDYTVTAANPVGFVVTTISLEVDGAPSDLSYQGNPFVWWEGKDYSISPSMTGLVESFTIDPKLPAGLVIDPATGVISGAPSASQLVKKYTVTATNPAGKATSEIQITVNGKPGKITYAENPFILWKGAAFESAVPTVVGSADNFVIIPDLPSGLTLNQTTGVISGVPAGTQAAADYTITATNPVGSNNTKITISINDKPSGLSYPKGTYTFLTDKAIDAQSPSVTGVVTGYSVTPDLPAGIKLDSKTGAISGTPSAVSSKKTYTVTASNPAGNTTAALLIEVSLRTWTRLLGATGIETYGNSIAMDNASNLHVTGYTKGNLDGQTITGSEDLFYTKYYSNGTKFWTRLLGVAGAKTEAYSIAIDSSSSVYIAGYTEGNLDGQTKTGTEAAFVTKYSSDGVKQWTRLLSNDLKTQGKAVTTDSSGNIYITGYTTGSLDSQTITGTMDFFITKYASDGTKLWTKLLGASGAGTWANDIKADSSGNVYVTGATRGGLDGQYLMGTYDIFISKYSSGGVKQWTRTLGALGQSCQGYGVTADTAGNIYITGWTTGSLNGQPVLGAQDTFIAKYSSIGEKLWAVQLGAIDAMTIATGITFNGTGNLYITGNANKTLDSHTLTGVQDAFIANYASADGAKKWVRLLGVSGASTEGAGIVADSDETLFIAGSTNGDLGKESLNGVYDSFIMKWIE